MSPSGRIGRIRPSWRVAEAQTMAEYVVVLAVITPIVILAFATLSGAVLPALAGGSSAVSERRQSTDGERAECGTRSYEGNHSQRSQREEEPYQRQQSRQQARGHGQQCNEEAGQHRSEPFPSAPVSMPGLS